MKYRLFLQIGTIVIVILSLFTTVAMADFNESYDSFLKTYDDYRIDHEKYITTRNQYLTYNTLTAKNDALVAVKDFLTQRNSVLLSYITLLRLKNTDSTYTNLLDDEQNFLTDHAQKIPAIASLDDAVGHSKLAEERHVPFQVTSKKIVSTFLLTKVQVSKTAFTNLENETNSLITILRTQGKDVTTLERWVLEAKNKEFLVGQKLTATENQINTLRADSIENVTEQYNKIQFTLFEAQQYLKEGMRLLSEVAETIKYGQF